MLTNFPNQTETQTFTLTCLSKTLSQQINWKWHLINSPKFTLASQKVGSLIAQVQVTFWLKNGNLSITNFPSECSSFQNRNLIHNHDSHINQVWGEESKFSMKRRKYSLCTSINSDWQANSKVSSFDSASNTPTTKFIPMRPKKQ